MSATRIKTEYTKLKTKIHRSYKRSGKGRERHWEKIEQKDCTGCKQKCGSCGEPFTTSTAMNERLFCSLHCERVAT